MCHIVAVNELPTVALPCLGHSGEVVDPEADASIVLKRLAIETLGWQERQYVQQLAAQAGGQAVEYRVVAVFRLELEQPLRVCRMKGTS
jgi:hypothetical protein